MSLSERFKRLPEEQQLRNEESARQAREASELLKRLRVTRQEAENVAKEEIERTRKLQREEVQMHPDVVDLKRRLAGAEREQTIWERKQKDQERNYKNELDSLNREEANLLNRFNSVQNDELRLRQEQEKIENERKGKEQRFRDLEKKLDMIKKEEESQFVNDMDVLKRQIQDLEKRLPAGDQESNKNQLSKYENEIRNLQELREKDLDERTKFVEKERQAAIDLNKARELLNEAKSLEFQKRNELEDVKELIGGPHSYENAQRNFFEAEKRAKELETHQQDLKRQLESRNRLVEEKNRRMEGIRSEIKRLQQELTELDIACSSDYNAQFELGNELNGLEYDLKDAKDRVNAARKDLDFFTQERAKFSEKTAELEREIGNVRQSLQEAENEERRASDLCDEIGKRCNDMDRLTESQNKRIEELNRKAMDLRSSMSEYDLIRNEINEKRAKLNEVQSRWNEWRIARRAPLQQELDELRSWLSSHPKLEAISTARSTAVLNDLERIRGRIRDLNSRFPAVPINFENPEQLRAAISAKEAEIWNRLDTRTGAFSQRFMTQLEREAEALMRAEVAATHEQKQAAIEKETAELSKLRLSLKPQVNIDEEARGRLWRSNLESSETGQIADQVLKLCQSRNITVKENE